MKCSYFPRSCPKISNKTKKCITCSLFNGCIYLMGVDTLKMYASCDTPFETEIKRQYAVELFNKKQ